MFENACLILVLSRSQILTKTAVFKQVYDCVTYG